MKLAVSGILAVAAVFLMGAKGNGCSAEYQPGDGRDSSWTLGPIPKATGPDKPMSCEWLESDNCWKQFARKVEACAPTGVGTFDEEREVCSFDNGGLLQLAGPISEPADNVTQFPIVNHRLLDADGEPCMTSKILDVGHHAYDVQGEVTVSQSTSLTTFRVICPDGSSYANDVEGTCPEFGLRWLFHKAPGYTLTCQGSTASCETEIWGADADGGAVVATCGEPLHGSAGGAGGAL